MRVSQACVCSCMRARCAGMRQETEGACLSCTAFQELRFVMDPFELPEGWQDTDPSTWELALDFGGNRFPIRLEVCAAFPSFPALLLHVYRARNQVKFALATFRGLIRQVFMHVLSAIWGNSRFGDYKKAHLLDKSDPRWLHKKEVCACVRACVDVSLSLSLSLSLHIRPVLTPREKGNASTI